MNWEPLYMKSPIFAQSILINLKGWQIKRRRYNSDFDQHLDYFINSNPEQIDLVQLKYFLKESSYTPFWKDRFREFNVNIDYKDCLIDELKKLPLLTKKEVKENYNKIINKNIKENVVLNHTSGTTGSGLVFPQTLSMERKQWAVWWRYRFMHGISFNTWMGWFGGRTIANINQKKPPFWRVNYPMKQLMFSLHHLNEKNVSLYHKEILKRKLKWLHGYPSQLALFANLIKSNNLPYITCVEFITVGAENLLEYQRKVIEEVFNVPVRQHYGLAEGVSNISENPDGILRADQDFCLTEFIEGINLGENQKKIVGTNYNNLAFPLIRYDTGDIVEIDSKNKNNIKSIDGRMEDYVTLPNGTKIGRLDHVFKDLIHIQEAQIYQKDLNNLIIRLVKGPKYEETNTESKLIIELKKRLGIEMIILIEYLEIIPKEKSGKLRFVISEIKK
jgi:phenylacetate-CoA ligase